MSAVFEGLVVKGRLERTELRFGKGQLVALVGPNGSGKTSLLHAMAGVSGTADCRRIEGEPLPDGQPARRARLIGLMPASRDLAWPIPVRDLLSLAPSPPDKDRVEQLVTTLELTDFLNRPSNQLSTGERARVILARTLACEPRLLLLDEPTGNLDPYWALKIVEMLAEEARTGSTIVAAMHDFDLARRFDRMLLMHDRRLVDDGPPEDVMQTLEFGETFRLRASARGWRPA